MDTIEHINARENREIRWIHICLVVFACVGLAGAWITLLHADIRVFFPAFPVSLPIADILDIFPVVFFAPVLFQFFRVRAQSLVFSPSRLSSTAKTSTSASDPPGVIPDGLLVPRSPPYEMSSFSNYHISMFVSALALWVMGTGLHNAANTLDHILRDVNIEALCQYPEAVEGVRHFQTERCILHDVYKVNYFLDEQLSHIIQHSALHILSLICFWRQVRNPFYLFSQRSRPTPSSQCSSFLPLLCGVVYGMLIFGFTVEGQTVPIGLPYTVLMLTLVLYQYFAVQREWVSEEWDLRVKLHTPMVVYYGTSSAVALSLMSAWGVWNGGSFPEFSALGLIP